MSINFCPFLLSTNYSNETADLTTMCNQCAMFRKHIKREVAGNEIIYYCGLAGKPETEVGRIERK